jgi:hypothetical protein
MFDYDNDNDNVPGIQYLVPSNIAVAQAPKGRDISAQGNALGPRGVAPGWYVRPRWGRPARQGGTGY